MELVLAAIFALIMGIAAILLVEFVANPRLEVNRAAADVELFDFPPGNPVMRFVRVNVINKPVAAWCIRRFLFRRTAIACRSFVEFADLGTGVPMPSPPLPQSTKWTIRPEGQYSLDPNTGRLFRLIDGSMFPLIETIDIGPQTPQNLDLVVKHQGDPDFYMHNALNLQGNLRHPANRINGTSFRLTVEIRAENGKSKHRSFILRNLGSNIQDLTLDDDC